MNNTQGQGSPPQPGNDSQHSAEPVFCVCLQHGGHSYCGWCPVPVVRLAVESDDSRGGHEHEFRVRHWKCVAPP
jgi:hypothetical protein